MTRMRRLLIIPRRRIVSGIAAWAAALLLAGTPSFAADADLCSTPARPDAVPHVVLDGVGYLLDAPKIARVRSPTVGFDRGSEPEISRTFRVVECGTGREAHAGPVAPWNDGAVDPSSGDKVHLFDFSALTRPGRYVVTDESGILRSPPFAIGRDVYRPALNAALRALFYQRAGYPKQEPFAGPLWRDAASHLRPDQDVGATPFDRPGDRARARDLRGGWYDAGDATKYTNWTARYVIALLKAFAENPPAFGDDIGIPESANGVPDVLDEARWGLDWLRRMQDDEGAVLSIVGLSEASPPSSAQNPSAYGPPSTSSTASTAAAFALAARAFRRVGDAAAAEEFLERSKRAFRWCLAHPDATFFNNDRNAGTQGLGSGQQEVDDYGRRQLILEASVYLFAATGDPSFRDVFDAMYGTSHLIQWRYFAPFEGEKEEFLLDYVELADGTDRVQQEIRQAFAAAMSSDDNRRAMSAGVEAGAYAAFIPHYVWGSNGVKANQGSILKRWRALMPRGQPSSDAAAPAFIHYLHGANPLGTAYLTNMSGLGVERSVQHMYHFWFAHLPRGEAGTSTVPPGFLVGGPNPSYQPDGCCPGSCGQANGLCALGSRTPPRSQPDQKSFIDFDAGWPANSWALTENSNGYQTAYIRLLSKFVQ